MNIKAVQVEISKLELQPGQILAVRFQQKLDAEMFRQISQYLKWLVPEGVKVAVLDNNAEFVVIDPKS